MSIALLEVPEDTPEAWQTAYDSLTCQLLILRSTYHRTVGFGPFETITGELSQGIFNGELWQK